MIYQFLDAVKEIEEPNLGGCLFMCLAFWRWLEKNNLPRDDFGIIQFDYGGDQIEHNLRWIHMRDCEKPVSSNHFAWRYQGEIWDAEGEVDLKDHCHHHHRELHGLNPDLVEEFCVEALEYGCWNLYFNREAAAEILKENLDLDMWDVI